MTDTGRKAHRVESPFAGVAGVRWHTNCHPRTTCEADLQAIQAQLPGARPNIGHHDPIPQLQLRLEKQTDGPTLTLIDLWVPIESDALAASLLVSYGFEIS